MVDEVRIWLASTAEFPSELFCGSFDGSRIQDFLHELRSVQKPERLQRFDLQHSESSRHVSPQFEKDKKCEREQKQEPEGLTTSEKKEPTKERVDGPSLQAVVSHDTVAPRKSGEGATAARTGVPPMAAHFPTASSPCAIDVTSLRREFGEEAAALLATFSLQAVLCTWR